MFLLDSLMISGIRWALQTVLTAAEAEMNDDSSLRDRLLEAEMQREMGEISDQELADIEADVLRAIRDLKTRREGGSGALAFGDGQPIETGEDGHFRIEAEVSGDFYGPSDSAAETDVNMTAPAIEESRSVAPHTDPRRARHRGKRRPATGTGRSLRTRRTTRAK